MTAFYSCGRDKANDTKPMNNLTLGELRAAGGTHHSTSGPAPPLPLVPDRLWRGPDCMHHQQIHSLLNNKITNVPKTCVLSDARSDADSSVIYLLSYCISILPPLATETSELSSILFTQMHHQKRMTMKHKLGFSHAGGTSSWLCSESTFQMRLHYCYTQLQHRNGVSLQMSSALLYSPLVY